MNERTDDFNRRSLILHEQLRGKISLHNNMPLRTLDDLSLAYTPGVAEPCRAISKDPGRVRDLTLKGNAVAIVSGGSAVLGLGNIGPEAAIPATRITEKLRIASAYALADSVVDLCLEKILPSPLDISVAPRVAAAVGKAWEGKKNLVGEDRKKFRFSGLHKPNFQNILKMMKDGDGKEEKVSDPLAEARESFITHWGVMGSSWGINRTMAQIHALLLASPGALSTDEVMEELQISRGNANTNLRDLVGWGLVRSVIRKGERKEFFEAEKDAWKILSAIARERKRREVEPAIEVLDACRAKAAEARSPEAEGFARQMEELGDLMKLGARVLDKASASEQSRIMGLAKMFFLGKG